MKFSLFSAQSKHKRGNACFKIKNKNVDNWPNGDY